MADSGRRLPAAVVRSGTSSSGSRRMTMGTVDARTLLRGLYLELTAEYDEASAEVADVVRAADRAGDDDIDAGSKVAQREQQLSLMASIRDRRNQVEHALL